MPTNTTSNAIFYLFVAGFPLCISVVTFSPVLILSFSMVSQIHISRRSIRCKVKPIYFPFVKRSDTGDNEQSGVDTSESTDWESDDYWLQQIRKQGAQRPEYRWFQDRSSLPFECTACGKCCKTKGNVYMNPEEHEAAAVLLEISKEAFVQQYASHTLIEASRDGNEHVWLRLADHPSATEDENELIDESRGCIFLQEDNTCRIYEARPIQCSTYPFWPNILASRKAWNDEVRQIEDSHETSSTSDSRNLPPKWTRDGGGCEGMQRIGEEYDDEEVDPIQGVPKEQVYEQVYWYEHDERRFPRSDEHPPVV